MRTLRNDQKHLEAPQSTFRESRALKKFPNYMALKSKVLEEATNQEVWRKSRVKDDARDIVPS